MAVFTPVSHDEAARLLSGYGLGELRSITGIESGIENSNFFIDTTAGRYVLTIFERLACAQLPFYLGLMRHLAARGIPCPDPVADRTGGLFTLFKDKPAAIVTRLSGISIETAQIPHCEQVGALLAAMHRGASDYAIEVPNPRGRPWWEATAPRVRPFLDPSQRALLDDEMQAQRAFATGSGFSSLPGGAVHADLFRDNVLFEDTADGTIRLGGVIDFYFAGCDSWLYDIAVTANDWCVVEDGKLESSRLAAFWRAYTAVRDISAEEREAWPMMLRAAALRFWLSRLFDLHCPRPAQVVHPKDPGHFERLLRIRREILPPSGRQ